MNETNNENLLVGSTKEVPTGKQSSKNMKHGEESRAMLLALLNSPLESLLAMGDAVILGTGKAGGRVGTLLVIYDAVPTANNLLAESEKE